MKTNNFDLIIHGEVIGKIIETGDTLAFLDYGESVSIKYIKFRRLSDNSIQTWEVGGYTVDLVEKTVTIGE